MERPKERRLATAALIGSGAGISASALLNKLALGAGMDPIWLNVFRLGLAALMTLVYCLARPNSRKELLGIRGRFLLLTLLSGVMLSAHFAAWAAALRYTDSVVAVTIWSTYSLMTVVGSSFLLKEKTPLPALLGLGLATLGVGVCAVGATGPQLVGVAMALCAALTQTVYTLCGRAVRQKAAMVPYTASVYSTAFLCLLVAAAFLGPPRGGFAARGVGASFLLALFCTLGGHSLQNYALKVYKAPTVSAVTLTEVFTGPLLVYAVLGEAPRTASLVGGGVILCGVAWYLYSERTRERAAAGQAARSAQ